MNNNINNIDNIIEAILFASGDSVPIKDIATIIEKSENETKNITQSLMNKYDNNKSGIKIIQVGDAFQMCTNPLYFPYIKNMYTLPKKKGLSQPTLETLAIIAYKQPITKSEIEHIRGVNSDYCVNNLLKHSLVEEKGRLDAIGKPIIFGTTESFLKYFGFSSLDNMPTTKNDDELKKIVEDELPSPNID